MAREIANVQTSLWGNPEWKGLGVIEQWLYLHLMSHPTLSYAGVADWVPKRLAASSSGLTVDRVVTAAIRLQDARFVYIAEATDEILIRSFLRHDGLLKQPKLSVSMVNAFSAIASLEIQKIVVNELQRLAVEFPHWKAFESEKVQVILKYEGADMAEFTQGFTPGVTPELTPGFTLNGDRDLGLRTATATSTATSSKEDIGRAKRSHQMPKDWKPSESNIKKAKDAGLNLDFEVEQFTNHHLAKGSTFKDWHRAFATWLGNSTKYGGASSAGQQQAVSLWTKKGPF